MLALKLDVSMSLLSFEFEIVQVGSVSNEPILEPEPCKNIRGHQQTYPSLQTRGGHDVLVLAHEPPVLDVPVEGDVVRLVPLVQGLLVTGDRPPSQPGRVGEVGDDLAIHQGFLLLSEGLNI